MKKNTFISTFVLASIMMVSLQFASGSKRATGKAARAKEVVVYTYDSFAGEWGPGPELIEKFQKASGYKLTLVDCGDAVQALNRAILEKNKVQADVIIGIDNNLADEARKAGILAKYTPKDADKLIAPELTAALGADGLLTPYDYSHFAIIYDTQSRIPAPQSLEDLTKDIYRKKIILMDPRTSTPGLGFLAWTVAVFGDGYKDYWKQLRPNILSMTPGWSAGWGMFMKNEAPLVISYTTSPAYNVEYDHDKRYQALVFEEGHVQQVEGYALLKNAPNPKGAKAFMDFLISEEAQSVLPLTQWMYPVNKQVALPDSYRQAAPVPQKTLSADSKMTAEALGTVPALLAQ
ncbi:MAG TPA: thiamine ABC transporter substrate-binding protein [Treponema sp.]|nr:thiamine ABC transporter substrate-binding protein [Treponema sp.]